VHESELVDGPDWPIHREETNAILIALMDLTYDVRTILALLEDDDEETEEDA